MSRCPAETTLPRIYLLLENPTKSHNLGPIIRCASAFGIDVVIAVGYEKCSVDGAHGANKHVRIIGFPTVEQGVAYIRESLQCQIVLGLIGAIPGGFGPTILRRNGCEIVHGIAKDFIDQANDWHATSVPVSDLNLSDQNICLAISKETGSLPWALASYCEIFCHVPHLAVDCDIALLDTPATMSIALHYCTAKLGYDETSYAGHKFDVASRRQLNQQASYIRRQERQLMRQTATAAAAEIESSSSALFHADGELGDGDY